MKWEYCVATFRHKNDEELKNWLDELGVDGWELVGVIPTVMVGNTEGAKLIFKHKRG